MPERRPPSRSLAKGGPPTFIHTGAPAPTSSERSGFRARRWNDDGAFAACSSTNPRSNRTRCPSTDRPASARSLRAPSCSTSRPICSQIRIAVRWIVSSCSAERTSGASSRVNIRTLHQRHEQALEGRDAEVVDLERLAHPLGDLASAGLALRVRVLTDEQDPAEVAEHLVLQPREPVDPQAADPGAIPVPYEPVGQEVDADVLGEPLEQLARVPLEAVDTGRASGRIPLEHRIEPAAGAAVAVHDDHPLVAGQQLLELLLDRRPDLERGHVELGRDAVDVGVPPALLHDRGGVLGDGAAGDERNGSSYGRHPLASRSGATTDSGGKARFATNSSLKSVAPESSRYSTNAGSSNATSRSRNDMSAIFAPSLAALPTARIRSTGTRGTRPRIRALSGLM